MNRVYKTDQIYFLSKAVGVSQADVKRVLDCYTDRLKEKLSNGETIKFLNICYLVNSENKQYYHETLAYISTEIGNETKLGKELVLRILTTYEDTIARDLRKFYTYGVRGLVKFRYTEYRNGICRLRVNKGSNLDSNIRVITLNSFRRKVELDDRENS